MADNSFTFNLDQYLSTTLLNYRTKSGKMYDNIFLANPTFWALHQKGKKSFWHGGERIIIPLQKGENSTISDYARYDPIDTTPQDNQTAAYYEIKQKSGSVVIDGLSLRQNRGKYQLISLLNAKIKETEMTMAQKINQDLYRVTPASSKAINSIPSLIVPYGSSYDAQAPGGISGVTYSFWRNVIKTSAATTWQLLVQEMRNVYNSCSEGATGAGGFPDLCITNQLTYEMYETHLDTKSRYVNVSEFGKKAQTAGFENVKFKSADMFFDVYVPDLYGDASTIGYDALLLNAASGWTYGTIFFLNSDCIEYVVDPGTDLKIGKFQKPHNQDAKVCPLLHYHQLTINNRRKLGALMKIDQTLAS